MCKILYELMLLLIYICNMHTYAILDLRENTGAFHFINAVLDHVSATFQRFARKKKRNALRMEASLHRNLSLINAPRAAYEAALQQHARE